MAQSRNTVLEALLVEYGYSHRQLTLEVNRVCWEVLGKRGECTDRHVRRWISGEVRWPWTHYLLALQEIFNRPPQALGFVPRGRNSTNLPAVPPRRAGGEEAGMHRRRFVTASTATTLSVALGLHLLPETGRLTMSDVDRINGSIARLDAHFFALGGGPVLTVATTYTDRLSTVLERCTYGERVEKALHSSLSSLYAAAGWAAHDGDDAPLAARLHTASLQSAQLAGDATAAARAWSDLAMQARVEGRHRQAVQLTRAALNDRRARQDPRVAALLHSRLAVGQARTHDPVGAARSLLAAERVYDKAGTDPGPAWLAFLGPAELSGLAAITHQALGDHRRAAACTEQTLTLLPDSMVRSRAYYGVQLAELRLALGEREQAAATVHDLDPGTLGSRRISIRLRTVQRALGGTRP